MRKVRQQFAGLTSIELENEWKKRHERSRRSARYARFRIYYMIIIGLLASSIGAWNGFVRTTSDTGISTRLPVIDQLERMQGSVLGVTPEQTKQALPPGHASLPMDLLGLVLSATSLVLTVLLIVNVRRYLRQRTNIDSDNDHFPPLSKEASEAVDQLLLPLCDRMRIDRSSLRLLRSKNSVAFSPSMVENPSRGLFLFVIPSDFLTIVVQNPAAAEAMLAHELGHVSQKDSRLWLYASVFADNLVRFFVPMNILNLVVVLVIIAAAALTFWPPTIVLLPIIAYLLFIGVAPLLSLMHFYREIRKARRSSEELADLAAWLFTFPHGLGLLKAFELYDAQAAKVQQEHKTQTPSPEDAAASFGFFGDIFTNSKYFGIHPPISYRIEKARHYASVTSGDTRKLRLTNYGFVYEGVLITLGIAVPVIAAILYPVFQKVGEKARQISCMSNLKQLALGIMQYEQDNDELMPGTLDRKGRNIPDPGPNDKVVAWSDAVMPYVKSTGVYRCPNAKNPEGLVAQGLSSPVPTSYLYNGTLSIQSDASMSAPSYTAMLHEDDELDAIGQQSPSLPNGTTLSGEKPNRKSNQAIHFNRARYDNNHMDGTNVGFADGHVKYQSKAKIKYNWFGAIESGNQSPITFDTNDKSADASFDKPYKVSLDGINY